MVTKTIKRRLLGRKISHTPNKTFVASAYRIEDEWGVRYETLFTQTSSFEEGSRKEALASVVSLIEAANNAYLNSNGGE